LNRSHRRAEIGGQSSRIFYRVSQMGTVETRRQSCLDRI